MPLTNLNTTDWAPQAYVDAVTGQVNNFTNPTSYEEARDLYIKAYENAALLQAFINGGAPGGHARIHLVDGNPTLGYGLDLVTGGVRSTHLVDLFTHVFGALGTLGVDDLADGVELVRKWKTTIDNAPDEVHTVTVTDANGIPLFSASVEVTSGHIADGAQGNLVANVSFMPPPNVTFTTAQQGEVGVHKKGRVK